MTAVRQVVTLIKKLKNKQMKSKIKILLSFLLFSSCSIAQQTNTEITREELYSHIKFLAGDSLKGRYPGTTEDKIAAEYIRNNFKYSNLNFVNQDGLQDFEIITNLYLGDKNNLTFKNGIYEPLKDFTPVPFTANKELKATIVFTGYGFNIQTNDIQWNDYAAVDVTGKWVLILRGLPDSDNPNSPYIMYSSDRSKAILAKDNGAAGVIFVSGPVFDQADELILLENPQGNIDIPVIQIKRELADKILQNSSKTISQLETQLNNEKQPLSFFIDEEISACTNVELEKKETYNIVSKLITDNSENAEFIVIGAHYDHLGYGGIGTGSRNPNITAIHYGADDNASGVASMLEIAERLSSNKEYLKKNFLFIAFGAEEMGLIGSKYFTGNMPVNKEQIMAMINIDMVGRMKPDSSLQIGGVGTAIENDSLVNLINKNYNLRLGLSQEGYGPSDHSSFYSINIPVFFISTGAHTDYHTPGDSLGNINFNGLLTVTNFIYDLAYELGTSNTRLTYKDAGPKTPTGNRNGRNFKISLGIMPDFSGVVKNGLRVDLVIDNKPAQKGGMRTGDIIVAINGMPVGDVYEYMERLKSLKAGQIITVEVIRENENKVLLIQL
ncbi:MAG: hypothetical protein A2X13_01780 [Bacteroidetes bacterium GWC2_33_15]|nr:MAG: hypothetical protein A2X10_07845 [Bacteroidetes bacterium GWA2_33_15]OFX52209.1 MAG: hypothetical protein A2X13_01780 [Bacteroidetes bacterium GWC2_33_15]OFX64363.1 MAG: hypothetical protein A2X15_12600 [Bacteroidetes bacterium GWB2_32_14]OFX67768.1 MAG: hypothetical protein A2X14_06425 [Bacteroidetes bacterium GWD2_33_33]HAN19380.1 hypothetical protein [Bacteroidales bacterium]